MMLGFFFLFSCINIFIDVVPFWSVWLPMALFRSVVGFIVVGLVRYEYYPYSWLCSALILDVVAVYKDNSMMS